jgi:hypothetical protein
MGGKIMSRCKYEGNHQPESMADALGKCYCDRCVREREKDGRIRRLERENKRLKRKRYI